MKNVYIGMSGGVDSSVTAALLKEQGYSVTGVYMKNWTQDVAGFECPWRQDLTDAQSVAAHLDIPLKVYDFQDQYRQKVVDYMVSEYRKGNTPNPDIMCNQEIKFKLFLETALSEGADLIATGHYAQILPLQGGTSQVGLFAAQDENKDQSYFLYRVTEEALGKSLMPLGDLAKPQVRKLAKKFHLPTADKPDSQGICFIGEVSIKEFLQQYIPARPGPIKHVDGRTLAEHEGVQFYTIGQRQGLGIGGGLPLYVADKDVKTNTLFVTENLDVLKSDSFRITDLHWINDRPDLAIPYLVRTRHRGKLTQCRLIATDSNKYLTLQLKDTERALTAGQSAVIYEQEKAGLRVVGGGVIVPN